MKFNEEEMEIVKTRFCFGEELNVYRTPVTPLENFKRMIQGKPLWQVSINDYVYLFPNCVPDNPAKGNVSDKKLPPEALGGYDMFGILWEYEEDIGGSTVRPGNPVLADANDWPKIIKFPTKATIDGWDWAECQANAASYEDDYFWEPVICTGWFERLISFMDFQYAAMALIDPAQKKAVKALFDRLSDLYILIIDKYSACFPGKIHCFCLHDDWGHQRGQLISLATAREMIVPAMKKVTDHIHTLGMVTEVHSCGKIDNLIPAFIEAGFDLLECQPLLDYETVVPQYGDRIIVHLAPENVPPEHAPMESHQACARAFVDRVVALGHPVILETYYSPRLTPAFWEELYRYSRLRFDE